MLTPERRNAFLERKLAALLEHAEPERPVVPMPGTPASLFDRFAGVFHAFSCLEEHVLGALKRGAEKEAYYRLLGESYDSLPTLAKQVKHSAEKDPVTAYVTLQCAIEVFRRLRGLLKREGIESDFLNRPVIKTLCGDYEAEWRRDCNEGIRPRISWSGPPEPDQFFLWYEKTFASPVKFVRDADGQEAVK